MQNPNVGIDYRITGMGELNRSGSIYGAQAASFLTGLSAAIQTGTLVGAQQNGSKPVNGCVTPDFDNLLGHPVTSLFPAEFDSDFEPFYKGIGDRNRKVLLNTVDALIDAGVSLTGVKFQNFYYSDKPGHLSYGLTLVGLNPSALGNLEGYRDGYRSPGGVGRASLEVTFGTYNTANVDVDLRNPNSKNPFAILAHGIEIMTNAVGRRPTNPDTVTRRLNQRGVSTSVRCTR